MTSIRIYESALCCDTGVCGVDVDQALVTLTADVRYLKDAGVDIHRHNLASDPEAFAANETVRAYLRTVGSQGLPLTLVDGVTVAAGSYPTREFLLGVAGVPSEPAPTARGDLGLVAAASASASCCGGSHGC